jgi:hypothetical protein
MTPARPKNEKKKKKKKMKQSTIGTRQLGKYQGVKGHSHKRRRKNHPLQSPLDDTCPITIQGFSNFNPNSSATLRLFIGVLV